MGGGLGKKACSLRALHVFVAFGAEDKKRLRNFDWLSEFSFQNNKTLYDDSPFFWIRANRIFGAVGKFIISIN